MRVSVRGTGVRASVRAAHRAVCSPTLAFGVSTERSSEWHADETTRHTVPVERPSKEHRSIFQIRWRINGGPARYETVGPDRKEAEQALALKLAEINRGQHREQRDATFLEFASEWFANHRAHLKPATVVDYRLTLERHLLPYFGEYLVSQITAELIERYVADKARERQERDRRVTELQAELANRREAGEPVEGVRRRLYAAKQDRGLCNRSINKTVERFSRCSRPR